MKQIPQYDLVIIGGGMVGASLAVALRSTNLKIAIVEKFSFQDNHQPSFDARCIALAFGSFRILRSMGITDELQDYLTAINTIHISDQGHFGVTRLNADEQQVPALGYVVENRDFGRVLMKHINNSKHIHLICPAELASIENKNDILNIHLNHADSPTLQCKLVIAADGASSLTRQLLAISHETHDYQQDAIISTVETSEPHHGMAFERFTSHGPVALLPIRQQRCSLVYTVKRENTASTLELGDEQFLNRLQSDMGYRLGKFTRLGRRHCYPLKLIRAKRLVCQRGALIGNAAHSLHPIAGQGFNLGIRDAAYLAEIIIDASNQGLDIGDLSVLKKYEQHQQLDHQSTIKFTDRLVNIFSNNFSPLSYSRSKALGLTNLIPGTKTRLAQQAMGVKGHLPRLARGLRL